MKFRKQNIGSGHESFDHSEPKFTQVLILDENDKIVAHLVGLSAKVASTVLLSALNGEKQSVIKKHSLVARPVKDSPIFWSMEDESENNPYILVKKAFQFKDGIIRIDSEQTFSATVKDEQGNRIMAPWPMS